MVERLSALHKVAHPRRRGSDQGEAPGIILQELRANDIGQLSVFDGSLTAIQPKLKTALGLGTLAANKATLCKKARALPNGSDRWLLVSHGEPLQSLVGKLPISHATYTDLSHARTIIRLTGSASRELLSRGLMIDLHPGVFVDGMVAIAPIHHMSVVVHRQGEAFDLYAMRSYAQDVFDWLCTHGDPFGVEILAAQPLESRD